jgi:hypothetical protein
MFVRLDILKTFFDNVAVHVTLRVKGGQDSMYLRTICTILNILIEFGVFKFFNRF